jgi:Zn-dependent protease
MKFEFRIGSIPVTVHGSFFLVIAFLGFGREGDGQLHPVALAQWIVVAFIGVLLHELGHALVGRSFGLVPKIDLIGFGGLTSWIGSERRALEAPKRIAISLAGPFTGIAIGLATFALIRMRGGLSPFASLFALDTPWTPLAVDIAWVNAGWGVFNLLPILPLDGGNVLFQSLRWFTHGGGERAARLISCGVAALGGLWALAVGWVFPAIFAGLFAIQNFQAFRAAGAPPPPRKEGGSPPRGAPPRF